MRGLLWAGGMARASAGAGGWGGGCEVGRGGRPEGLRGVGVWESWEAAGWEASALAGQLLNCWGGFVRLVKAKVRVEQETGVLRTSESA